MGGRLKERCGAIPAGGTIVCRKGGKGRPVRGDTSTIGIKIYSQRSGLQKPGRYECLESHGA